MIIAIVFAGLVAGLASGSMVLFVLDFGWLMGIAGFYAGAFVGVGLAAARVATLGEKQDGAASAGAQGRMA